jgi:hypothetical protein
MARMTMMVDPVVLAKLRELARLRGVSMAELAREALAEKAAELRPGLTCVGVAASGRKDISSRAGVGRTHVVSVQT